MRVHCLHTASSNVAVFNDAAEALAIPGLVVDHTVRADLLAAVEEAGVLTFVVREQTRGLLQALGGAADAVLLTCSTLGPAAEGFDSAPSAPIMRVDGALARAAIKRGGAVCVLCAVETTLVPTTELFQRLARGTDVQLDIRLVAGAWAAFKAGDEERYFAMIAQAADEAADGGASTIALAQASMAGAVQHCRRSAPLSSPSEGLRAAAHATAGRVI